MLVLFVAERCAHVVLTSNSSVPCPVVPAWCHSCVPQTLVLLRCFTFGDPLQHDCLNLKHTKTPPPKSNHIQPIHELALNTSHGAPCVHKIKLFRVHKVILSGETGLSTYSHHTRSDERCDGETDAQVPGLGSISTGSWVRAKTSQIFYQKQQRLPRSRSPYREKSKCLEQKG